MPPHLVDRVLENGDIVEGDWRRTTINDSNLTSIQRVGANMASRIVYDIRDRLSDYLVSAVGAVPWQFNYVNICTQIMNTFDS